MTEHVVIPLRQYDSVEEILPYLEFVARPGMEVIFLARKENIYPWWCAYDLGAFRQSRNAVPVGTLAASIVRQRQTRLAEEHISTARRILQEKRISVRLEFCSTSLKRAVRNYCDGDTNLVIVAGGRFRLKQLTSTLHRWFQPFGATEAPPILLLRADRNL